jgi:hypothetical protein
MVRATAISPSSRSFRAVSTRSFWIESAIPSKERARSPIWSRDLVLTRTEKSLRARRFSARLLGLCVR